MKTQILISINQNGLHDISLVAETKNECKEILQTYKKFEPEILSFLTAMHQKTTRGVSANLGQQK